MLRNLVERLKTTPAQPAITPPAPAAPPRSAYKQHWNSLAGSEEAAKIAVSGYVDEELYLRTAQATLAMLEKYAGVGPQDVVLEIGAGVGRVGAVLAPLCREWIGTDVSENMVAHIRQRLAAFANVRGVACSGFDLAEIASESVDLVYCTVVFMHLEEWERYNYIVEAMRILRPGGRMLVDNVNLVSDDGWRFFEELRRLPPADRPPHISKTSTPQELETYFRRAGFTEIRLETENLWIIACGRKPAAIA